MIMTGYTTSHPDSLHYSGMAGTELIRYNNWSTSRDIAYRVDLPNLADYYMMRGFAVAGDLVFLGVSASSEITAYDRATGAYKGSLWPESSTGWLDIHYPISAYRRTNGEYIVLSEAVVLNAIMVYRMTLAGGGTRRRLSR